MDGGRAGDRVHAGGAGADDRAGRDQFPGRRSSFEPRDPHLRLPAERVRERGHPRARGRAGGYGRRQHLRGHRGGGAAVPAGDRRRAPGPAGRGDRGDRLRGADRAGAVGGAAGRAPGARQSGEAAGGELACRRARRGCGHSARRTAHPAPAIPACPAAPAPCSTCSRAATTPAPSASSRRAGGRSRSVPVADAVAQVRGLAEAGINEVVLTGVDLASYASGDARLGDLVLAILRWRAGAAPAAPLLARPGGDRSRRSGAALAEQPRLMPHLHLSLQSGADLILKRMRRRHSRAQALAVIERARRLRPGPRHRRRPDRRLPDRDRRAVPARRSTSSRRPPAVSARLPVQRAPRHAGRADAGGAGPAPPRAGRAPARGRGADRRGVPRGLPRPDRPRRRRARRHAAIPSISPASGSPARTRSAQVVEARVIAADAAGLEAA